jgi:cardiolipin synthase
VNIPNTLTLARIVLVPLVIWLIVTHEMTAAFILFLLAGFSDAADGYLAKRFHWRTELGAYLDPIADKLLLVSIYVTLGFSNHLPAWLVIAVVSRDILIIGAFLLSWVLSRPVPIRPLLISKANTLAQIVLAGLVLAELGLGLGLHDLILVLVPITGALTIISAFAYFWGWLTHMASYEPEPPPRPVRQSKPLASKPVAVKGPGQSQAGAS